MTVPCWVKGCHGDHDRFTHPEHTCLPPITPDVAKRRRKHGQKVRNIVMPVLPNGWTCECGKKWKRTTHGWELLT